MDNASEPKVGSFRPLRILSTEDDPQIRIMLCDLLILEGHTIEFARNSDDFFRLTDKFSYDLLILDVNVPGMNGYQIAREVGARMGERKPKILIFTGRDSREEVGLVLASGADAILEKGAPLATITDTVHKLTSILEGPVPLPKPRPAQSATPDSIFPTTPPSPVPTRPPMPQPARPVPATPTTAVPVAAATPENTSFSEEIDRLNKRISSAISENASVSTRIQTLQKKLTELEKTLSNARDEITGLRGLVKSFALFLSLVALALAVWIAFGQ